MAGSAAVQRQRKSPQQTILSRKLRWLRSTAVAPRLRFLPAVEASAGAAAVASSRGATPPAILRPRAGPIALRAAPCEYRHSAQAHRPGPSLRCLCRSPRLRHRCLRQPAAAPVAHPRHRFEPALCRAASPPAQPDFAPEALATLARRGERRRSYRLVGRRAPPRASYAPSRTVYPTVVY